MTIEEARIVLAGIQASRLTELHDVLFRSAEKYAGVRAEWALATREERGVWMLGAHAPIMPSLMPAIS